MPVAHDADDIYIYIYIYINYNKLGSHLFAFILLPIISYNGYTFLVMVMRQNKGRYKFHEAMGGARYVTVTLGGNRYVDPSSNTD